MGGSSGLIRSLGGVNHSQIAFGHSHLILATRPDSQIISGLTPAQGGRDISPFATPLDGVPGDRLFSAPLLQTTVAEQRDRWRTLCLVKSACLPERCTHRRHVIETEVTLIRQDYEGTWSEFADAFGQHIADELRTLIETAVLKIPADSLP